MTDDLQPKKREIGKRKRIIKKNYELNPTKGHKKITETFLIQRDEFLGQTVQLQFKRSTC